MSQPTPYSRSYGFAAAQAADPVSPLPAVPLDAEFDNAAKTFSDILRNLALIQRDDGALADGRVRRGIHIPGLVSAEGCVVMELRRGRE